MAKNAISRWRKSFKDNTTPFQWTQNKYRELWLTEPLDENAVLIESQQGRSPFGNMFYVVKELASSPAYRKFDIYYAANDSQEQRFIDAFEYAGIENVTILKRSNPRYIELLASAKYLITDTAWPMYYVKKPGQILWNTWHGTPLKALGRHDKTDCHRLGNVQRNFIKSDFLSYPSKYMYDHMVEDYMLSNICDATVLFGGYPRNTILFGNAISEEIAEKFRLKSKRVYAYMPTWRASEKYPVRYMDYAVMTYLIQIDSRLQDDEHMFVNLHPLARKVVNFRVFKHISPFPAEIETYQFLSMCDVLITDYSSVLFDFPLTRKKVVLFSYDKDLYYEERGMYVDIDSLPFPKVNNVLDLLEEVRSPKQYDESSFLEKYCSYESPDATRILCERVFFGEKKLPETRIPKNDKKNVLIYAGNMAKNGLTTSLSSLMHFLGDEYNFFLTFNSNYVARNKQFIATIPDSISYIPIVGNITMSIVERFYNYRYNRKNKNIDWFLTKCKDAYLFDNKRIFSDIPFSNVIHFTGYDYRYLYALSLFDANRIIFAHADMIEEIKIGRVDHATMTKHAYSEYDKIAVVSEGIIDTTRTLAGNRHPIVVVPNTFNYQRVVSLSKEPVAYSPSTKANVDADELARRLKAADKTIACIGRFSPEKQHALLIEAFNELWPRYKNSHLVIVGGMCVSDIFDETLDYVESLPCAQHISLVRNIDNPYAILAQTDGLILPSKYEGFGLVLMEADALGKPVVSTDIDGPRVFMQNHGGCLIENSLEGVKEGLEKLLLGELKPLNVDYEAYNAHAMQQFYSLLE